MLSREEAEFLAGRLRRGGELDVHWDTDEGHEVVLVGLPDGRIAWELFLNPADAFAPGPVRAGRWSQDQLVAFLRALVPGARYVLSSVGQKSRDSGPKCRSSSPLAACRA